jgi:hypothetical protein
MWTCSSVSFIHLLHELYVLLLQDVDQLLAALHDSALQVATAIAEKAAAEREAAAPSSSSADRAEAQQLRTEVQELRVQLQGHDAKERQLLAEVAALKVCTLDGTAVGQVGWITTTHDCHSVMRSQTALYLLMYNPVMQSVKLESCTPLIEYMQQQMG